MYRWNRTKKRKYWILLTIYKKTIFILVSTFLWYRYIQNTFKKNIEIFLFFFFCWENSENVDFAHIYIKKLQQHFYQLKENRNSFEENLSSWQNFLFSFISAHILAIIQNISRIYTVYTYICAVEFWGYDCYGGNLYKKIYL